ncbi:MAG: hypothetical protein GY835_05505 [bacterium]|nr:hypothetical protein [bacterium]
MLKQFVLLCTLVGLILPLPANAILLGNHQLTFDLLGTTNYFEFADFKEYEFPVQGLDWGGFGLPDLFDDLDPDLPNNPNDPGFIYQNRNQIQMKFIGSLDVGMRLKTAISPNWSVEGFFRYTPVDLIITFNGTDVSESQFTRYSGVTNPGDLELNWIEGDYPTYHVVRFGANLDYTVYRSNDNALNAFVSGGLGAITFFREGDLMVATDNPNGDEGTVPTAPLNLDYYIPHDSFVTANLGVGGVFFIHRYFGLSLDLRMNFAPFNIKDRSEFDSVNAFFFSGSLGYSLRFKL